MGDDFADLIILPPAITYNEHHPEHTDSPPDHLKNIDHNYFNKIDQNDLLELSVVHPISTNENTNKKLPVLCAQNAASDDSKRKNQQKDVTRESSKSKAESDDFLVTSSEAAEVLNMIKTNVNGYSDDKVKIALSNKGLWTKFQNVQTEMIVTKSGRRMFPTLSFVVSGLEQNDKYSMYVYFKPRDDETWKYQNLNWKPVGKNQTLNKETLLCKHPQSPTTGKVWNSCNEISFAKVKLTNNKQCKMAGQIILNSMSFYNPQLIIINEANSEKSMTYGVDEANFVAVTAYQNSALTQLKIDHNPFAKGFREAPQRNVLSFNPNIIPPQFATNISQMNCAQNPGPFPSHALHGLPSGATRQFNSGLTPQNAIQSVAACPPYNANTMYQMPQNLNSNFSTNPNGLCRPPIRAINPYLPYTAPILPNNQTPAFHFMSSQTPTQNAHRPSYQSQITPWPSNYNYIAGPSIGQFQQFCPTLTYGSLNPYSMPPLEEHNSYAQLPLNQQFIGNADNASGRKRSFAEVDTNCDVTDASVSQNVSTEIQEPLSKSSCQTSEHSFVSMTRTGIPELIKYNAEGSQNVFKTVQPLSVAIPENDEFKENRDPESDYDNCGPKMDPENGLNVNQLANIPLPLYTNNLLCQTPGANHVQNNFNFAHPHYQASY